MFKSRINDFQHFPIFLARLATIAAISTGSTGFAA
jgi:hypothetical protein